MATTSPTNPSALPPRDSLFKEDPIFREDSGRQTTIPDNADIIELAERRPRSKSMLEAIYRKVLPGEQHVSSCQVQTCTVSSHGVDNKMQVCEISYPSNTHMFRECHTDRSGWAHILSHGVAGRWAILSRASCHTEWLGAGLCAALPPEHMHSRAAGPSSTRHSHSQHLFYKSCRRTGGPRADVEQQALLSWTT